jgi:hypothetical protein
MQKIPTDKAVSNNINNDNNNNTSNDNLALALIDALRDTSNFAV